MWWLRFVPAADVGAEVADAAISRKLHISSSNEELSATMMSWTPSSSPQVFEQHTRLGIHV